MALDIGEERSDELKVLYLNIMGGDAVEATLQLDLALLAVALLQPPPHLYSLRTLMVIPREGLVKVKV